MFSRTLGGQDRHGKNDAPGFNPTILAYFARRPFRDGATGMTSTHEARSLEWRYHRPG